MKYQAFFEIELEHSYTSDALAYAKIQPDAATVKRLQGDRLLLKRTPNGLLVLAPTNGENIDLPAFGANEKLGFNIFSNKADFRELTDFSSIEDHQSLLFSNRDLVSDTSDLGVSGISANEKLNGFPQVGRVEILLDRITIGADGKAPTYTVRFASKSMIWKYYFITKDDAANLSINHKSLSFKRLDEDATDVVFNKLKTNFTPEGLHIKAFESEQLLASQNVPRKDIQLKNENTTIISHLPNPEVSDRGIKIIRIN